MYNQHFGLREAPFNLTPDPRFLFLTWRQRQVLAGFTYALMSGKRFIVLTGDVGAGKTTLVASAVRGPCSRRIQFSMISNPTLTADEMVEAALLGFNLCDVPPGKPDGLAALEHIVGYGKQQGRTSAIVIDEAHKLPPEAFRQVRALNGLELLQVVLVGQNELKDMVGRKELRPGIGIHLTLEALAPQEVQLYISHRWTKAGGIRMPFQPDAVEAVVRYAGGSPRLINAICDNTLILAHGEQSRFASASHVLAAVARLQVPEPDTSSADTRAAGNGQAASHRKRTGAGVDVMHAS